MDKVILVTGAFCIGYITRYAVSSFIIKILIDELKKVRSHPKNDFNEDLSQYQ